MAEHDEHDAPPFPGVNGAAHYSIGTTDHIEGARWTQEEAMAWLDRRTRGQQYYDTPLDPQMAWADELRPDLHQAQEGVRALLRLMGEDPARPGLVDTPSRVVKAYLEMADRPGDPAQLLGKVFTDVDTEDSEMIAVPGIEFVSLCEHHLLPFTGTATVAYLPGPAGVVGLSKIPRLVQHYAHRPQVQERLTQQIRDAMVTHLDPVGVGVVIQAHHSCMGLRGVRAQSATMVTSALSGRFLEHPATRAEFLTLAVGR